MYILQQKYTAVPRKQSYKYTGYRIMYKLQMQYSNPTAQSGLFSVMERVRTIVQCTLIASVAIQDEKHALFTQIFIYQSIQTEVYLDPAVSTETPVMLWTSIGMVCFLS